ncbi:MAG: 23S rRNA (guanosine(2251)-2'-O)-methyltransferase RlmB [Proteobacteria bacterium]|nr:23S rRNA (guanosine(2251)-2'-O)-methyltransferase RlmB [Paracoccaceae bacterium]MDA1180910.1 23S rRNA (guanosine(2251)-2'-O)-methyltransferase RlmB [Pseudomonadota bacterium]
MSKNKPQKSLNTGKIQIIHGMHAVRAALLNTKRVHLELHITENNHEFARNYKSTIEKITILNQKEFKNLYGGEKSTQGIVLKTNDFERPSLQQFVKNENVNDKSVLLALDQITDPQNIGSIMRSCALFNCKGILLAKDNAPDLTPSLYKAASGAAEIVNYFRVTNLKRSISELKKYGYWVYGFDSSEDSKSSNINFTKKSILVFGSEGKGMRDLVKKECDEIIKINMHQNKHYQIDSLNVSNAATIALYEFFKS